LKCAISKLGAEQIDRLKISSKTTREIKDLFHITIPEKSETVLSLGDSYMSSASSLFTTEIESTLGKNSVHLQ